MTTALEGGEWSAARPGRTLYPEKNRYPFYRRLGGPQGRSGRAENLVPTGIRFRVVYRSQNIYGASSDIRWAEDVACVMEREGFHRILVGKLEGKRPF